MTLCRHCDGRGWMFTAYRGGASRVIQCVVCKGERKASDENAATDARIDGTDHQAGTT